MSYPTAPEGQPYPPYQPPQPPQPKRKRHIGRNIAISVGSAVALVIIIGVIANATGAGKTAGTYNPPPVTKAPALVAPTPTPTPQASTPTQLAIGQAEMIEDNDNASDTASITITSMWNTTQPSDPYGETPQNGYYVIADETVTSQFNGLFASASDFYVVENGTEYPEGNGNSYEATTNDNEINGTINAGNTERGQLYFDVPSVHGELVYAPNAQGAPLAQWSF